ncbi:MAG: hypothetical protein AAB250_14035 [Bdellovibrionota bacterium]
MKAFVHSFLVVLTIGLSSVALAAKPTKIAPMVSAVLVDPRFGQLIAERSEIASANGMVLRITTQHTLKIGTQWFVFFDLVEEVGAVVPKTSTLVGSIDAEILMPVGGPLSVGGLYFSPAAEAPGTGASVGN